MLSDPSRSSSESPRPRGVLREREAEPFQIVDAGHRYLISIQDFPLATAGTYKLQLFLRERGVDERWRKVAEYPVDVAHIDVPG